MTESIVVAIITGVLTLVGTVITVLSANRKTISSLEIQQAKTDQKIENLTKEVQKHNNFAERMPVVENDIKTIYNRIDKIESEVKS